MGTTGADLDHAHDDPTTGLIPRAVKDMFLQLEQEKKQAAGNMTWECKVSFLELYNEVSASRHCFKNALIPACRILSTCSRHRLSKVRLSPSAKTGARSSGRVCAR